MDIPSKVHSSVLIWATCYINKHDALNILNLEMKYIYLYIFLFQSSFQDFNILINQNKYSSDPFKFKIFLLKLCQWKKKFNNWQLSSRTPSLQRRTQAPPRQWKLLPILLFSSSPKTGIVRASTARWIQFIWEVPAF